MVPNDAKVQAQRLKEAKKALQKMWLKRGLSESGKRGLEHEVGNHDAATPQETHLHLKHSDKSEDKFKQEKSAHKSERKKVIGVKSIKRAHGDKERHSRRSSNLVNTDQNVYDAALSFRGPCVPYAATRNVKIKSKTAREKKVKGGHKDSSELIIEDDCVDETLEDRSRTKRNRKHKTMCVSVVADDGEDVSSAKSKKGAKRKRSEVSDESTLIASHSVPDTNRVVEMLDKHRAAVPLSVTMSSGGHCPLPEVPQEVDVEDDMNYPGNTPKWKCGSRKSRKKKFRITSGEVCVSSDIEDTESNSVESVDEVAVVDAGEVEDAEDLADDDGICQETNCAPHSVVFHYIDRSVILQLKHPATLHFNGLLEVEVIQGGVDILGYGLSMGQGSKIVYSPRGSSLLSLQSMDQSGDGGSRSRILQELDGSRLEALLQSGSKDDCWLLLSKVESKIPHFVERYISHQLFPQPTSAERDHPYWKAGRKLQCIFGAPSGNKLFRKGNNWDELAERVANQQQGCSVLCGGKGVGKSTLLRYLTNRILSSSSPAPHGVVLLDLDPGQAELTPPGCVSLSLVQQPLLGPNYTHFQQPVRSYFLGDVNVANCASRYLAACKMLVEYWQSQSEFHGLPCLVNTMGFNKGLGVSLITQILSLLCPTLVVQIQSRSANRNFPGLLSADFIQRSALQAPRLLSDRQSLFGRSILCTSAHELQVLDSAAEAKSNKNEWGLDARSLREISILSYFSQASSPPKYSFLDIVPYACPFDGLYLCVCHEPVPPSLVLSALNGSLVGLCSVFPDQEDVILSTDLSMPAIISRLPLAPCLGYGIVRGIDMETQQLYLTTPLQHETLDSVNCLVMGAITIPPSLLLTPPAAPGQVPFVTVGASQQTSRPSRRLYRPTWQDVRNS